MFHLVFAGVLSSQTQFSASVPANTINVPLTLANPVVYYNETIAAVGVSTPSGAVSCSGLCPEISFRHKRGALGADDGFLNRQSKVVEARKLRPIMHLCKYFPGVGCRLGADSDYSFPCGVLDRAESRCKPPQ